MDGEEADVNKILEEDDVNEWIGSLYRRENDTEPFDFYVRKEQFLTRPDRAELEAKYDRLKIDVEVNSLYHPINSPLPYHLLVLSL